MRKREIGVDREREKGSGIGCLESERVAGGIQCVTSQMITGGDTCTAYVHYYQYKRKINDGRD